MRYKLKLNLNYMKLNNMKLGHEFYSKDALSLSKELLGKVLVRKVDGHILKGKIVETEAYIGAIDKACHAFGGRRTEKLEPLYAKGGISYVYFIYGMYFCFNVIAGKKDEAEGVLIRAIEPLEGLEYMAKVRTKKSPDELTNAQLINISNGPSKLCMAMKIDKSQNWADLAESEELYIEEASPISMENIVKAKRIGIDYAEEAKDFLWRFYIKDNIWVSNGTK